MPTIKLVVIGASGVGKTSLRGQYISGRFSNGYRATIGADFITKTLPHPSNPSESVTLQIWDTAGQERFSSLSTAFFRGADAALLIFDVNTPHTMEALTKWWAEFRDRAPLADEDMEDYCCVVVGNKIDMTGNANANGNGTVSETQALDFLRELVPPSSRPPSPIHVLPPDGLDLHRELSSDHEPFEDDNLPTPSQATAQVEFPRLSTPSPPPQPRSNSIAIVQKNGTAHTPSYSPKHQLSKSRSRASSHFYGGTMTTTHTTLTIYHTPSSSLFDVYQSARSSPEPASSSNSPNNTLGIRARRMTSLSTGSTSTGSAATITPSLFARENSRNVSTELTSPEDESYPPSGLPPPPARGPKLFFTSAKTGEGVSDVFEYVAQRVVRRWEYEERIEARRMHYREASAADTVRLGLYNHGQKRDKTWSGCCGS